MKRPRSPDAISGSLSDYANSGGRSRSVDSDTSSNSESEDDSFAGDAARYNRDLVSWEKHYQDLDRAASSNNFAKADRACEILCDDKWPKRLLSRPWSKMPDDSIRPWKGDRLVYPPAYRVIDGVREAWICMLMDYCKWDRAVKIADQYINDKRCMYLTGKAQMALNKLHALLESRRMQEAFSFFQRLLDGTPQMNEILRTVESSHTYQWHYSLARIHFLHNELEKAQHHSEMACVELERSGGRGEDEPLQTRMWVQMIRAWTSGLTCVTSRNAAEVQKMLELWEKTVCDLDRKSVQLTLGLKSASVFGRLKFVEFLLFAVRAFPELEINSYAEMNLPENSNVFSIGRMFLAKLRAITNELLHKCELSVEVTNARYHPLLDQALTQLGYLSTSNEKLLNNWALVIDAGPVGNQGRFANHTDDPNAVLAIGHASGVRVRMLRAIKDINKNDEITVHYGANYWETITENRKSTFSKKYAPAPKSSSSKKPTTTGAGFYAFKARYEFEFFDGIVSDLNGSGVPATVLLASLGETGTSSRARDMELSCKQKGLRIEDCPKNHAAFPGKMLVADRDFYVGEKICIYAGVMTRMPEAQLKLNESDYISTVCNSSCGPYGLELEDPEARSGCVFKKIQRGLPTLTPCSASGLFIPNALPAVDLSEITDIRGLGLECTQKLLGALQDPTKRDIVGRLLKRLCNLPDKQWKMHAQNEIKRVLFKPVSVPAAPLPPPSVTAAATPPLPLVDEVVELDDEEVDESDSPVSVAAATVPQKGSIDYAIHAFNLSKGLAKPVTLPPSPPDQSKLPQRTLIERLMQSRRVIEFQENMKPSQARANDV